MKRLWALVLCFILAFTTFAGSSPSATTASASSTAEGKTTDATIESQPVQEEATAEPTLEPTAEPTPEPTEEPTPEPTPKELLPLEVVEFGYSMSDKYLYYSICVRNPNDDVILLSPMVRIVPRDKDGLVINTYERTFRQIYPGREVWLAEMACECSEVPATVDAIPLSVNENNRKLVQKEYIPLRIENSKLRSGEFNDTLVGEVFNDNDYEVELAVVSMMFRDEEGKLLGGDLTIAEKIPPRSSAPFSLDVYSPYSSNYEVHVENWDRN